MMLSRGKYLAKLAKARLSESPTYKHVAAAPAKNTVENKILPLQKISGINTCEIGENVDESCILRKNLEESTLLDVANQITESHVLLEEFAVNEEDLISSDFDTIFCGVPPKIFDLGDVVNIERGNYTSTAKPPIASFGNEEFSCFIGGNTEDISNNCPSHVFIDTNEKSFVDSKACGEDISTSKPIETNHALGSSKDCEHITISLGHQEFLNLAGGNIEISDDEQSIVFPVLDIQEQNELHKEKEFPSLNCHVNDDESIVAGSTDEDDNDKDITYQPRETDNESSSSGDSDQNLEVIIQENRSNTEENNGLSENSDKENDDGGTFENRGKAVKRKRKNMRVENKKLRMHGKSYLGMKKNDEGKSRLCKQKTERILEEKPCTGRCAKGWGGRKCKCIDDTTRKEIFNKFWENMDWGEKRIYIMGLVEKVETARKTGMSEESRRKYSYKFFLKKGDIKFKVCQSLFLSTFGLRNEIVYRWLADDVSHGIPKLSPSNKIKNNDKPRAKKAAEEFLQNLPRLPSHYCRSQTSKLYLETEHKSLSELYHDYKSLMEAERKPVYGITQFNHLFNKHNLAFFKPKKDLCDLCCSFKAGTVDETTYNAHLKRKEDAAKAKEEDKKYGQETGKIKVITMDLQSLLLCPKLNASCLYYKTKLCCHNFTFFDVCSKETMCYFWNETASDLNASTFVSCIIDYLDKIDLEGIERVVFYSDGCTYQNRNIVLANALLQFSVSHNIEIQQKYLERGHTYLECDSIHAAIERKIRNRDIFIPQQYVEAIRGARKEQYDIKYVDYSFFKDFSKLQFYTSIRPGIGVGSAVVTDVRVLRYTQDGSIQFKLNHNDLVFTDLRKPRSFTSSFSDNVQSLHSRPIKLKKSKYQHLQQIKAVIPSDYHAYYDTLPHE